MPCHEERDLAYPYRIHCHSLLAIYEQGGGRGGGGGAGRGAGRGGVGGDLIGLC